MLNAKLLSGIGMVVVVSGWAGPASAQSTWRSLTNTPPGFLETCLLLTDGAVMCHEWNTNRWHHLRPDVNGSYAAGTWNSTVIPPMPDGVDPSFGCNPCSYQPLFFASAVLASGNVVVIGGEYVNLQFRWTNIGFMYDPVANAWSSQLVEPFGGGNVGDAQSVILANGTLLLAGVRNGFDRNMSSFDEATLTFTALNPAGKADSNSDEGWDILPDGRVLTVNGFISTSYELYDPLANLWTTPPGGTVVTLTDTITGSAAAGPAVLRPDGTLLHFSSNSLGQNALYNTVTGTWSHAASMDFPLVPMETFHFSVKEGPASLLPNGNVLVMAAPTPDLANVFSMPSHFFEMDLATNTLFAVVDSPNAAAFAAFHGRMLLLPTGEVLLSAYNQLPAGAGGVQDVVLYSNGGGPQDPWRPTIVAVPAQLTPGATHVVSGTLFNGFSEGAAYGDDAQMSTNYPLVRIRNNATGHIFYARTHDHSRMGVSPVGSTEIVTTSFDVPPGIERGASTLVVVTNGIPSQARNVMVGVNRGAIALCQNVTVPANASCQGNATAADVNAGSSDPDGDPITCVLAPAGPFPLGNTPVVLTCTDPQGASGSCSAVVTVVDNTPPTLVCPVSVNVLCTGPNGATATFATSATDNCGSVGPITCAPPSGSTFPLGTTLDTCTVNDGRGNKGACTFNVTVALGDSPVCCPAGTNVILGTSNNDTINGTGGPDCILGRGSQDVINGNGGNDLISGGDGDDVISGGTGDDLVFGGSGQDRLSGNTGNDVMSGGDGDDQLFGGDGNDRLLGGQGQDRLFGENNNDTLVGETGDDRLEGGAGDDLLTGGGLHDVCIGGPGTDTFLTCENQTQ